MHGVSTREIITAYIALGSNLGDRHAALSEAAQLLRRCPGVLGVRLSPVFETAPVGGVPQGPYLNACAAVDTVLPPRDLLDALLNTEQQMGRVRTVRWGPRLIDLDLLLYGDEVLQEPGLVVPHARMHERDFVLAPLRALAPGLVHPTLHHTVTALLEMLGSGAGALRGVEAAAPAEREATA